MHDVDDDNDDDDDDITDPGRSAERKWKEKSAKKAK